MANLTCDGTPFGACAIRVAKLDSLGFPLVGAGNAYVSHAPIEVKFTKSKTTGTKFKQNDGCGNLKVSIQQPDQVDGMTVELTLCQLDAELLNFLTGGELISSGGNVIGYYEPPLGLVSGNGVTFEVWAQNWTGTHLNATRPYVRFGCGKTLWTAGDIDLKEAIATIPVTAVAYENPNFYNGGWNDWPLGGGTGMDRILGWFYDTALPTASCEPIAVPAS
jgi:hypothetical protein